MKPCSWLLVSACLAACGPATPPPAPPGSTAPEAPETTAPPDDKGPGASGGEADDKDADGIKDEKQRADDKPDAPSPAKESKEGEKSKGKPGHVGAATVDEKPLGGQLTQNDIKAVVEKNGEFFNDCYTMGAGKGEQFVAKVTLKVTLGPTGKVNQAVVTSSNTKNPKVDQCVVEGFKKIQFPKPKDGGTTVFSFPMQFGGAVQVQ